MTYFLFLLVLFLIVAPLTESGMSGAFLITGWIALFSLVGYILLG